MLIRSNSTLSMTNYKPVYRESDHELVGFVGKLPTDQWQTLTVFNYPLQEYATEQQAISALRATGLQILAEKWSFFDPELTDWYSCVIVEASPEKIRYKIVDWGHPNLEQEGVIQKPVPENFRLQ